MKRLNPMQTTLAMRISMTPSTLAEPTTAAQLPASQLRRRYSGALSLIALLTLASQIVVQYLIADQEHDARITNIAGRQRMLSQNIAKTSYYLADAGSAQAASSYRQQLEQQLSLWQRSHRGLLHGDSGLGLPGKNSGAIAALFARIEPDHAAIVAATESILARPGNAAALSRDISQIRQHESKFLIGMDDIVFRYDQEARDKVAYARRLELGLMGGTLLILLLAAVFIFAPATRRIQRDMQELAEREEDLRRLFAASPTAMLLVDHQDLSILQANQKAAMLIGLSQAELLKSALHEHLDNELAANRNFLAKLAHGEVLDEYAVVLHDANRSACETLVSVRPISFAGRPVLVLGVTNVSELKKAQKSLEYHATFDEMTGLANRRTGLLILSKSMARSKRDCQQLTVCFADLDGLKAANDHFGHAEGDWLIRTAAQVLADSIRSSDCAIRLGGDEFLLLLHQCSAEEGHALLSRAEVQLAEIGRQQHKPFNLSISFGAVAYAPLRHATPDALISEADAMMYRAKQQKKSLAQTAT